MGSRSATFSAGSRVSSLARARPAAAVARAMPAVRADGAVGKVKKVVLAYSGGLDTSVILKWLQVRSERDSSSARWVQFRHCVSDAGLAKAVPVGCCNHWFPFPTSLPPLWVSLETQCCAGGIASARGHCASNDFAGSRAILDWTHARLGNSTGREGPKSARGGKAQKST